MMKKIRIGLATLEPATFVMERKMLLLIKQRAEKGRSKAATERPSPRIQTPVVSR
jgi:hypothetical protein